VGTLAPSTPGSTAYVSKVCHEIFSDCEFEFWNFNGKLSIAGLIYAEERLCGIIIRSYYINLLKPKLAENAYYA